MSSPFITSPVTQAEPEVRDHITVVETVYHCPAFGGDAFVSESRFHRYLETYEQCYERKHIKVEEEWQRLDLGWIGDCGMLVILNEEGLYAQCNTTDEEKARTKSKVLEVAFLSPQGQDIPQEAPLGSWLVRAGETMRASPSSIPNLFIRCRSGRAYYTVRAFPA